MGFTLSLSTILTFLTQQRRFWEVFLMTIFGSVMQTLVRRRPLGFHDLVHSLTLVVYESYHYKYKY